MLSCWPVWKYSWFHQHYKKMSIFSPRNVLGSLGWDNNNDLLNSQSGVVGSFSSGGCCDSGVDTAAWLALLVGKTLFIKN